MPSLKSRRLGLAYAFLFSLLASPVNATDECLSLWDLDDRGYVESDDGYIITPRRENTEESSFRYTSDVLVINSKNFASLIAAPNNTLSGIRRLVFDARHIELDMRLNLHNAEVVLLADTIRLTRKAAILLAAPPAAGQRTGVTIIARSIDFSNAPRRPFQFTTRGANWNAVRLVRVVTPELITRAPIANPREYLESLTLNSSYAPPREPSLAEEFDIAVGTSEARNLHLATLKGEMTWPEYSAVLIQRQFARSPFNATNITSIRQRIATLHTLLPVNSHPSATAVLGRTEAAIAAGEDLLGYSRYQVPRRSFTTLSAEFTNIVNALLTDLANWNEVIVSARSGTAPSQTSVAEVNQQIREGLRDVNSIRADIDSAVTRLSEIEQEIQAREPNIVAQVEASRRAAETEARRARDAANIATATKVVAIGAAFLPVATPVALGIVTAIDATGKIIAHHQTGQTPDIRTVVLSIPESLDKAREFRSRADAVKVGWNKFRSAHDDFNTATSDETRNAADARRREGFSEFGGATTTLLQGLSLPTMPQLNMTQHEQSNSRLQALLAEVGRLRTEESRMIEQLAVRRRDLEVAQARTQQLEQSVRELRRADPRNDSNAQRLELLGWAIRERTLWDVVSAVAMLSRAFRYHTTRPLLSPVSESYFVSLYGSAGDAALTVRERLATMSVDDLRAFFRTEVDQLRTELTSLSTQSGRDYSNYKQGLVAWQETDTSFRFDCTQQDRRCRFIEVLNENLRRQVVARAANSNLPVPAPVLLPLEIPRLGGERPERLVDARIEVDFANASAMEGKTVIFSIVHPIYGRMPVGAKCYWVDFRARHAISNEQVFSTTCSGPQPCSHRTALTRQDYTDETNELVFMPYLTSYALRLDVQSARRANRIPQITGVTVHFRVLN